MKHRSLPAPIVVIMIAWFVCFFLVNGRSLIIDVNDNFRSWDFSLIQILAIRFVPTLIAIAGLILAIKSKYKKSGLLQFCMGIYIFSIFSSLLAYLKYGINGNALDYAWFALEVIFLVACVAGLLILSKNRATKFTYENVEGEITPVFYCANRTKRSLNFVIDMCIYTYIEVDIEQLMGIQEGTFLFFNLHSYLVLVSVIVIYYSFFEGVFQCTPGKCLTNTMVVDVYGEQPLFLEIVTRSLYRLIPLDAFSFFGYPTRGWHDTLSGTYVTHATDIDEEKPEGIFREAEVGF